MTTRFWLVMVMSLWGAFFFAAWAEEELKNPLGIIGVREETALTFWEDPTEIASVTGPSEREIYFPSRGVTLGIHQDRVWQIRFDETTSLSWNRLKAGVSREEVREILGTPYFSASHWDLYLLPGGSWPLRLRVFYRDAEAFDFYLYRGDF